MSLTQDVVTLFSGGIDPAIVFRNAILALTPTAFYDASISSLWQDSARTTVAVANADVIGAWDDLSGNGYHITQGTTANKPTLRTSVLNGKSVIRFDGSNDYLQNTSFPDFGDTYTAFAVAKFATGGDTSQCIFEVSNGTANTGFLLFHDTAAIARGRDATQMRSITGSDIRNDSWKLHSMWNTGSQMQYWVNASSINTVAYTAPNPNTLTTLDVGRIVASVAYLMNGDIQSLIIFNSQLSAGNRQAVETAINTRYAIY